MRQTILLLFLLSTAAVAVQAQSPSHHPPTKNTQTAHADSLPSAPTPNKPATTGKRRFGSIFGLAPNYRAARVGEHLPPPTPREAFGMATRSTFNSSSFALTGFTSLVSEGINSHPALGKGAAGFGRYYWRGFATKADGNYWVMFILPPVLHEDERYYVLGHGSILRRSVYAASRVFITPDYDGQDTINAAELLGRGAADGISMAYYPAEDRSFNHFVGRYGYSLLGDAATNVFREFLPDIAAHLRHPKQH